jgi:hypothetical protein
MTNLERSVNPFSGRQAFVLCLLKAINQKQMLDGLAWLFADD